MELNSYQELSVQQHAGLSLEDFTAVDDLHRRAAAQTLKHIKQPLNKTLK